ncbi:MarR family winged helix-turn-helix transcriptional regulator [Nocardia testacea]|uniref:MarR family winged helix-turn-helix transcriptional regulator n=1 Tax=Nocardia testacea TaxID=248551 RepID=UPI0002E182B5|nr:MarR family transcriptional regulator [Nocardia testacea]
MSSNSSELRALDHALREVARAVRKATPRLTGAEPLTDTQFETLRIIVHNPGAAAGELAALTGTQPSNMSVTLRQLGEYGLIDREPDPSDRRCSRILPTDKAIAHAREIEAVRTRLVLDALGTLSPADQQSLTAAIGGLRALADALTGTAPTRTRPGTGRPSLPPGTD